VGIFRPNLEGIFNLFSKLGLVKQVAKPICGSVVVPRQLPHAPITPVSSHCLLGFVAFRQSVTGTPDRLLALNRVSLKTLSAGVAREREVGEAVIIKPEGSDAKSESWGLEGLFERPQIPRQTRMPNLMERKSTRRVENGAAQPTSVSNKSVNWR
jgi:hypothetical protein